LVWALCAWAIGLGHMRLRHWSGPYVTKLLVWALCAWAVGLDPMCLGLVFMSYVTLSWPLSGPRALAFGLGLMHLSDWSALYAPGPSVWAFNVWALV